MSIYIIDQTIRILAHTEEICFFLSRLDFPSAVRAFAVYQLGFREEGFAGSAVHAFIVSFVDISFVVEIFKYFLYLRFVVRVGGTDELVIGSIHQIPDFFDLSGYLIYIFFRGDPCCFRFLFNLQAVLIGAGLEKNVITLKAFIACDTVCQDDLISIADVRFPGSISNRGGHIKFLLFHLITSVSLYFCA